MKIAVVELFSKIIALFSKKSKNGEKAQEIEEKKIDVFHEALVNILYVFIALIVLNAIFPSFMILGDWFYSIVEKLITYMISTIGG